MCSEAPASSLAAGNRLRAVLPRAQPLVVKAADNTNAASEREVAGSAVLSRLAADAAEIRERIARALARCNFMAMDW